MNTALQSEKFLIVWIPTSMIAILMFEISRANPKYDELTNCRTWAVKPGSDSIGTANSRGPLSGSCDNCNSWIALCGNAGSFAEASNFLRSQLERDFAAIADGLFHKQ